MHRFRVLRRYLHFPRYCIQTLLQWLLAVTFHEQVWENSQLHALQHHWIGLLHIVHSTYHLLVAQKCIESRKYGLLWQNNFWHLKNIWLVRCISILNTDIKFPCTEEGWKLQEYWLKSTCLSHSLLTLFRQKIFTFFTQFILIKMTYWWGKIWIHWISKPITVHSLFTNSSFYVLVNCRR